jgi:Ca-activated chloride channel family protein
MPHNLQAGDEPIVSLEVSLDRDALAPGEDRNVHLVARLDALAQAVERDRPRLSVAFALDVSHSMHGPPLEQVKRSVKMVLDALRPDDRVSIVAFAQGAHVVAEMTTLDAVSRARLKRGVDALETLPWTNVEAGLRAARSTLPQRELHERQVILLLSDGEPNIGEATPAGLGRIAEGFRGDVATTALGYGAHHHEDVLFAISRGGGGQYLFISDPLECQTDIARAVGAQAEVVASGLELTIQPEDGVEIEQVLHLGRPRFSPRGMTLALPDLMERGHRTLAARLRVRAPREPGPWRALRVRLRFIAPSSAGEHVLERTLELPVRHSGGGPRPIAQRAVAVARVDLVRDQARALADRHAFKNAAAVVRAMIAEIEDIDGFDPSEDCDLTQAYEQLVDEAVAYESNPTHERYRDFKRMQLGTEAATGGDHVQTKTMCGSLKVDLDALAMAYASSARLVGQAGRAEGCAVALGAETTIGRVQGNEVVVPSGRISKRHSRIVARDGKYILVDLKATNGTYCNGRRISSPVVLRHGDRIQVGDAEFVFEKD